MPLPSNRRKAKNKKNSRPRDLALRKRDANTAGLRWPVEVGQRGSCECGGAGSEPGDTEDGDRRGRAGRVVRGVTASGKAV